MEVAVQKGSIVILDCGGQYAHLIGSRIRRLGVFSEVRVPETPAGELQGAAGIILSGGPQSVYEKGSPQMDPALFELGIPILGICYGMQWMAHVLGGSVTPGKAKEYGRTSLQVVQPKGLLQDCGNECVVWMSHGDEVSTLPLGFEQIATSDTCTNAGMADESRKLFAVQFHPEVTHTEHGSDVLRRFVEQCDAASWSIEGYAKEVGAQLLKEVGDRNVFMLVSGGVDSSVAFTLLNETLGHDRVKGLLVDTGLMRKNEVVMIKQAFDTLGILNLHIEDASEEFFAALDGVSDPEEKRRIIGDTFLAVQKRVSESMDLDGWLLGQGTIYPDTIETGGTKHADTIKTHHNRVPAIQEMIEQGLVVEPLKDLYKDEVRRLGEELGLPHELVWRHPFPGPGLGVRILCVGEEERGESFEESGIDVPHSVLPVRSVGVQGDGRTYRHAVALFSSMPSEVSAETLTLATSIPGGNPQINRVLQCTSHAKAVDFVVTPSCITRERADVLREADAIVDEEMRTANLYESIWQFPVVLLPFGTSDGGQSIVLRPIESIDAMTANAVALPSDVLKRMTDRIMALQGIGSVFLDLTNKPPGTIEWE